MSNNVITGPWGAPVLAPAAFEVSGPLPTGTTVLEASAGTGKTFTIAALAARYVAEGIPTLPELMLVTFGREATTELRERVRERLVTAQRGLADPVAARAGDDEVLALLAPVLERFDAVVLGADVARRKPDPEGIVKCLDRLGVPPGSAIYVGDSDVDIAAGRAAGVGTVGVLTGAATSAMLSACGPDRLIADLSRLPGLLAQPG